VIPFMVHDLRHLFAKFTKPVAARAITAFTPRNIASRTTIFVVVMNLFFPWFVSLIYRIEVPSRHLVNPPSERLGLPHLISLSASGKQ